PGLLVAATALLEKNPRPSEAEVNDALGGVLCRCTGYRKIVAAVMDTGFVAETRNLAESGVGAAIPRVDGGPKVLGTEIYGADERPADALSVLVVRSPHWHARFSF